MSKGAVQYVGLLFLCLLSYASISPAQNDMGSRPSPPAQAAFSFSNGKKITIDYSSPRMNGRKIFGGLVPYGELWRAGANEATTFVTGERITVGGKTVPAGNYTIFTVPDADGWTLIISKKTGEWGIPYPGESYDFARTKMEVSKLSHPVEDFKIGFDKNGSGCVMYMEWETSRASVQIVPAT